MTWIDDPSFAELRAEVLHHRFLVRVLNAVSSLESFSVNELIIESNGEHNIPTIAVNCGLMFSNDFFDREPITSQNIDLLERTRQDVLSCGCQWRFAELFLCRVRKKWPINGIDEYEPEIQQMMKEINID